MSSSVWVRSAATMLLGRRAATVACSPRQWRPLAARAISTGEAAVSKPLHFLDGERTQPRNVDEKQRFNNLNPATGEVLSLVQESGAEDVDAAVASARAAFPEWAATPGPQRARVLRKAAEIIRHHRDDLAVAEVRDTGKPLWEARFDVDGIADSLDFFANLGATLFGVLVNNNQSAANQAAGQHVPVEGATFGYTVREPLGVVGAIGAFNFPLQMAAWKSGPALACGNTVVFKPSPLTPTTCVMLGEVYTDAGLPQGCYNVIQGNILAGEALSNHPHVAKMSFTGSVPTGSKVMAACAKDIKKVTLELGGKSPVLIFEDADLENAVKGTLMANFLTQGQVCSNGTRVYVHNSIMADFLKLLVGKASNMRVGDPMDEETHVGAMISQQQADKVMSYIEIGRQEGGTILCGGKKVDAGSKFSEGHFIAPTVITGLGDESRLVREEIFGPVVCVLGFENEEDVIRRANDSNFGLAGGVFTRELSRAHRVAGRLQAGNVYINNYNTYPPELPFGGYKQSGLGRECGTVCVDYFTQIKTVYVETGDVWCPY